MLLLDIKEDIRTGVIAERWLGYLLQQMNHEELGKLLEYYEKVGWISSTAKNKLMGIAMGIKSSGRGTWQVSSRIHLTSLLFMSYLAGIKLPRELHEINTYAREFIENPESFISV